MWHRRMLRPCDAGPGGRLRLVNLVPTRWYASLVMPSCVGLLLICVGLLLIWRRMRHGTAVPWRNWGLWLALGGCVELYVFSTPLVATWLAQSLEAQAPAVKIEDLPQADAIVVLAGDQTVYVRADGGVDMFNRCGDRMERGIQAFLANKAPVLALGDGINPVPNAPEFAEWQSDYAAKRGVPAAKIVRGRPARYTQDESEGVMEVLRPLGVKRIILATSAYHMMRARGVYHAHGVEVIALPCDFQSRGTAEHFSLKMLLPRGIALSQSETCLKEWLGTLVLWITGKGG
jgi:uncharacterized SAM-binding protein YcdF (DUF218 family)